MKLGTLVEQTLTAMDEYGFCVIPGLLPNDEATGLRKIIDQLRERESKPDGGQLGHQRVLHLAAKHPAFVALMCHPVTVAVYERYLGVDFVCSTWTTNTSLPDADLTYWHVDHPYWTIAPPYPVDPALTAHAIWCLDEFSESNGATKFISGSHRRTNLPQHNGNYDHEGVSVEAPAGSLIVAHGAIWHSAGRNSSGQPRTAIFGRYARSFVVPQEDMKCQLGVIENPSPLVERLLGKNRYFPQRELPY
jgi:ectoine hydroxylase-related dioxygenase (phytanoyl-CoA dioxygenase family)